MCCEGTEEEEIHTRSHDHVASTAWKPENNTRRGCVMSPSIVDVVTLLDLYMATFVLPEV